MTFQIPFQIYILIKEIRPIGEEIMVKSMGWVILGLLWHFGVAESQSSKFELGLSGGATFPNGANDLYILGNVRSGYFITDTFEAEAELGAFAYFGAPMTIYGAGNLQLQLPLSGSLWPFLLAGYGFSGGLLGHKYQAAVGVLNLGAGMKLVFEKIVALRIEYRFQQFSGGESYEEITSSSRTSVSAADLQLHGLLVGASLFL